MTDKNQNPDEEPKVNDKRRIDPETGEVRQPDATAGSEADASGPSAQEGAADEAAADDELTVDDILAAADDAAPEGEAPASNVREAELLSDLKRVNAEYANYRRRTEENREVEKQRTTGAVLDALLPVLDDLDRAEKHGDLEGDTAFAQISSKLRQSVERLGLVKFGTEGEAFDHNKHEAIFQQPSQDVETETIVDVVQTGYFVGDTLLRAAKVVVAVPAE
ncbi:nucleotide exchange factor GrpE [Paramicrobacterium agarici]|uniref:Protein GrpE n=1 Tax=Paramicrobacterium agarici TaxID=630514 RepID=A0A2A9DW94_9MICO|nr:nucleotide exchange factor GrpE [Microbacterium agarici]PFG30272.1 molecular chaperone GrpE [Microbacterium agarici]TQO23279.1 molecular chaperone GrpE [Microbacterium agarici]